MPRGPRFEKICARPRYQGDSTFCPSRPITEPLRPQPRSPGETKRNFPIGEIRLGVAFRINNSSRALKFVQKWCNSSASPSQICATHRVAFQSRKSKRANSLEAAEGAPRSNAKRTSAKKRACHRQRSKAILRASAGDASASQGATLPNICAIIKEFSHMQCHFVAPTPSQVQ